MKLTPALDKETGNSWDYGNGGFCVGGQSLEWVMGTRRKMEDYECSNIIDILKTRALLKQWGIPAPARLDKLLEKAIASDLNDEEGTKKEIECHHVTFTKEEAVRALRLDEEDPPQFDKIWYYRYFKFVDNDSLTKEEQTYIIQNVDFNMILKNSCPTDIKRAIRHPFVITDPKQMKRVLVANAYLKGDLEMHENFHQYITWEVLDMLTNQQFKELMNKFGFFPRGKFDEAKVRARIFSVLMNKKASEHENKNRDAEKLKAICYFLSSEKRYIMWRLLRDKEWFGHMALLELVTKKIHVPKDIYTHLDEHDTDEVDLHEVAEFLEKNPIPCTMKFAKEKGCKAIDYEPTQAPDPVPSPAPEPTPAVEHVAAEEPRVLVQA